MNKIFVTLVVLLSSISYTKAWSLPRPARAKYNFEGIVSLLDCSGSLFRFEDSLDDEKALILTNGHCDDSEAMPPGKYQYNTPSDRKVQLLDSEGNTVASLNAEKLVYATMSKTDIAIYRLPVTYAEILNSFGIRPLTMSSAHPKMGTAIDIISGLWVRGYSCSIETFVSTLKEEGWSEEDSIRYSKPGCETVNGTSGSPVIERSTRRLLAVHNTANDDGESCTADNPCEVDQQGNISVRQGAGYAQQVYLIYSCLNGHHELDLSTPGCQLPGANNL